jgi:hypothetical protein
MDGWTSTGMEEEQKRDKKLHTHVYIQYKHDVCQFGNWNYASAQEMTIMVSLCIESWHYMIQQFYVSHWIQFSLLLQNMI